MNEDNVRVKGAGRTTGVMALLEESVHIAARLGIMLCEMAGIVVLVITAARSLMLYFKRNSRLRLTLAQGIALALEFKLGGEVLRTVVIRQWTELLILAAVIALRGALTMLIHWEIRVEERRSDERAQ